jgi:hypothetical protein
MKLFEQDRSSLCLNVYFASQSSDASNKEKEISQQDVQPQPSQSTTTGLNLAAELNMASGPTGWETNEKEQDEKDANIKSTSGQVVECTLITCIY